MSNLGILTPKDVLDAKDAPYITKMQLRAASGGSFFGDVGSWFKGAANTVKDAVVDEIVPALRKEVVPIAIGAAKRSIGLGLSGGELLATGQSTHGGPTTSRGGRIDMSRSSGRAGKKSILEYM